MKELRSEQLKTIGGIARYAVAKHLYQEDIGRWLLRGLTREFEPSDLFDNVPERLEEAEVREILTNDKLDRSEDLACAIVKDLRDDLSPAALEDLGRIMNLLQQRLRGPLGDAKDYTIEQLLELQGVED